MSRWITRFEPAEPGTGPLAGLRFAVKDNIDVAGVPTTCADPRNRTPAAAAARCVSLLTDAGATLVGKTNLDQYATGLVGTRSPYGAEPSIYSAEHVSGGSSSGSALVVAHGEVDFALGTDTAGSGRVPAAFNGIVGIKPSKGLVSTCGVAPACRSLDCVSIFAADVDLADRVLAVLDVFDPDDPFARTLPRAAPVDRPILGVPATLPRLAPEHADAWRRTTTEAAGLATLVPVDIEPLLEAARLLYAGPWLAERWLAFGDRLDDDPAVDPVVRAVVSPGEQVTGAQAFAGFHRLAELAREAAALWATCDALLLPVTTRHPTIAEVAADPVGLNTELGTFTNMTNLLDLCAIAFPGPPRTDGLPFGIQLLAPAGHDARIIAIARRWLGEESVEAARPADHSLLAVAGAHLSGQPRNTDLRQLGASLVGPARLASGYRMFVVDGPIPRPGITRLREAHAEQPGPEVEVWRLPAAALGEFLSTVLPPLAIGPVELADGAQVLGFVCTADAADPARDITGLGGWRAYVQQPG